MEIISETKKGYTENFTLGSTFEESYAYVCWHSPNSRVLQELGFMFRKYQEAIARKAVNNLDAFKHIKTCSCPANTTSCIFKEPNGECYHPER